MDPNLTSQLSNLGKTSPGAASGAGAGAGTAIANAASNEVVKVILNSRAMAKAMSQYSVALEKYSSSSR